MYTRQRMRAVWNGCASVSFSIENGVKHGGILSPILFCVYIDEFFNCLIESKLGCHIGHVSYSALGYADDVGLLTPSVQAHVEDSGYASSSSVLAFRFEVNAYCCMPKP